MWGSSAVQPLVQWSGRAQGVVGITSLRHFGRGGGTAAAAPPPLCCSPRPWPTPCAAAAASSLLLSRPQQQWAVWCRPVAQQLHTLADPAGAAGSGAACAIQPGEVHLWWLDPSQVASEAELQRCSELLTEEELRECHSSGDAAVRRERVLARAHVRSVLAAYLAGAPHPSSLLFERNSHGKPRLVWPSATPAGHALRFNLTHTPSLIGLAVTADGLVGLDVEAAERRTRGDPMRLARRRFSEREVADLQTCPEGAGRAAYFLQLWTLKEAYVKALGRGISAPPGLRSFSFRVGGQQAAAADALLSQQQRVALGGTHALWRQGSEQPAGRCSTQPVAPAAAAAALAELDAPQESNGSGTTEGGSGGGGSSSSSSSSNSSSEASGIQFSTAASDSRGWRFALLQPAPGHVAALCVEGSRDDCSTGGGGGCDGNGQQGESGLLLRSFTVQPAALLSSSGLVASAADPQLLAQGTYSPC